MYRKILMLGMTLLLGVPASQAKKAPPTRAPGKQTNEPPLDKQTNEPPRVRADRSADKCLFFNYLSITSQPGTITLRR